MPKELKAVKITPDGAREDVVPANGKDWTLEELYKLIGTDVIETIRAVPPEGTRARWILILDEEGLYKDPCIQNPEATRLADGLLPGTTLSGTVIYCPARMLR